MQPGTPEYLRYVATGQVGAVQPPVMASDKTAIPSADEAVGSAQGVINAMPEAKAVSKKAYAGPTAGWRGWATAPFGSEASQATGHLTSIVTGISLAQLKATFGGNPTEGERKVLLDVQGSANMPEAMREKVFNRHEARRAAQDIAQERAGELCGGT